MICYKINKGKKICVEIKGHAHKNYVGFDPVCGMVSVLTQSAAEGCKLYQRCEIIMEDGELCFSVLNTKQTEAIVSAMEIGLQELSKEYPYCIKEGGI